jgi:peptide deformylase
MPLLEILKYPDPRLRTVALPVAEVNDEIRQLISDLFETMYLAPGIGLAASQVDVHQRIVVMDISEDQTHTLCFINPEILELTGKARCEEGCLSVPDVYETVERAEKIRVKALDRDGKEFELQADEILAVCIQHEMDHLDGKLFVDYISPLKRQRLKKKLSKAKKFAEPGAKLSSGSTVF